MKKLLILFLSIFTFTFIACNKDDDTIITDPFKPAKILTITSFHPETARKGAEIAIYGENFGKTISENYVTFDGWDAEVFQVPYEGMILVRVPSLAPGDYRVSVNANGLTGTSVKKIKVLDVIDTKF